MGECKPCAWPLATALESREGHMLHLAAHYDEASAIYECGSSLASVGLVHHPFEHNRLWSFLVALWWVVWQSGRLLALLEAPLPPLSRALG